MRGLDLWDSRKYAVLLADNMAESHTNIARYRQANE